MKLVETHIINANHAHFDEVDQMCFKSKNLYNYANYLVRQMFINSTKQKEIGEVDHATYLGYQDIRRLVLSQADYIAMPRKVSNETLKQLDKCWIGFFRSIKDWSKNPHKYKGRPRLPGYKHKTKGRNVTIFDLQALSKKALKNGKIKLSGTNIEVPFVNKDCKVNQARLIPINGEYKLEIIYEKTETINGNINHEIKASIDLGLNNLMALTYSSKGVQPLIVNGRPLKSMNQYYNKEKARLQSILPQKPNKSYSSKQILRLTNKRNNKIKDYIHKATARIVDELINHHVGELVIGLNSDWKQEINIGKKNNQNFVSIPFMMIINQLQYKCKLSGINVIVREESYTSKTSFLDEEQVSKHEEYVGRRVKRGLFKSSGNRLINADVNGSYNIMRKEFPEIFKYGIEGFAVNPEAVYCFV